MNFLPRVNSFFTAGKVWVLAWDTLNLQFGRFFFFSTLLCLQRAPEQIMLADIS